MRKMYRRRIITAGFVTCFVLGLTTHGPFASVDAAPAAHSSASTEYAQAQRLIHRLHITVPWDGRVSYGEKAKFCVEVFNGSRHGIRWHHVVPTGFYLKVCASGDYYVNDGVPFRHMHRW